jgi:trypsin
MQHGPRLAALALLALAASAAAAAGAPAAGGAANAYILPALTVSPTTKSTASAPRVDAQVSVGTEAAPGQFPWAVAISKYASLPPQCTGVLVSPTAVLTAAHCVADDQTPEAFAANAQLKIGGVDWRCTAATGCDVRRVTKVYVNPEYSGYTGAAADPVIGDLAILILSAPSTKAPARMVGVEAPLGSLAEVVGWGYVELSSAQPTAEVQERLRYATLQTRAAACCDEPFFDDASSVCSRPVGDALPAGFVAGSCSGDSGGPLTLSGTDILIGTTAYGIYEEVDANGSPVCGRYDASVQMSAARYRSWVASIVADLPPAPGAAEYPAPAPIVSKCVPAPAPPAPDDCAWAAGEYRVAAVGRFECGTEFASYYGGSARNQSLCTTQSVQLRSTKQLPNRDRALFRIAAAAGDGAFTVSTVRRGCAAGEARWTPSGTRLRLIAGSAATWILEPVGGDCDVVTFRSTAGLGLPYVSAPSAAGSLGCRSRELYLTAAETSSGRQSFKLTKVA